MNEPTNSLSRTASWVIVDRESEKAIFETFNEATASKVNKEKYKVIPILEYLQSLNREVKP